MPFLQLGIYYYIADILLETDGNSFVVWLYFGVFYCCVIGMAGVCMIFLPFSDEKTRDLSSIICCRWNEYHDDDQDDQKNVDKDVLFDEEAEEKAKQKQLSVQQQAEFIGWMVVEEDDDNNDNKNEVENV